MPKNVMDHKGLLVYLATKDNADTPGNVDVLENVDAQVFKASMVHLDQRVKFQDRKGKKDEMVAEENMEDAETKGRLDRKALWAILDIKGGKDL